MAEFASNGKGNLGVTLGAIGTGLSVLNGGLGNVLGGLGCGGYNGWNGNGMCGDNALVNRYEAGLNAEIGQLRTSVALRDANTFTDSKILETYKYFDGELKDIRSTLCAQAVMNQKTADSFDMVRNDLIATKNELYSSISRERDERCCADNAIVNYANATFYPKLVADVTVGTTTTAQMLYNPIPSCGKCCGK